MSTLISVIEKEKFRSDRKADSPYVWLSLAAFFFVGACILAGITWTAFDGYAALMLPGLIVILNVVLLCVTAAVLWNRVDQNFKDAMLEMAKALERQLNISVSDYAGFLILLERGARSRVLTQWGKNSSQSLQRPYDRKGAANLRI